MKILLFSSGGDEKSSLQYPDIHFGKVNLVVGDSGTGKTRLLNSIFNAGRMVVNKDRFYIGWWNITFEHVGKKYIWSIKTEKDSKDEKGKVVQESLSISENDSPRVLFDRSSDKFIYNGEDMPKLSLYETGISLLQEEEEIAPAFEAFKLIMRRNFSGSDLDVETGYQQVSQRLLKRISRDKKLDFLFSSETNVNVRMYIFYEYFKDIYEKICYEFIAIFPFVSEIKLLDAEDFDYHHPGVIPVLSYKEKGGNKWIPLYEFSSGMKKVLLILTDIFILPQKGAVYLVDEYENSLGMSAINFFPSVLFESDTPSQFIITSHHPYIIGNVPVGDWIVLHRKRNYVLIKQGVDLEEKFGKSKQKAFIKLINDPFYTEGIE